MNSILRPWKIDCVRVCFSGNRNLVPKRLKFARQKSHVQRTSGRMTGSLCFEFHYKFLLASVVTAVSVQSCGPGKYEGKNGRCELCHDNCRMIWPVRRGGWILVDSIPAIYRTHPVTPSLRTDAITFRCPASIQNNSYTVSSSFGSSKLDKSTQQSK